MRDREFCYRVIIRDLVDAFFMFWLNFIWCLRFGYVPNGNRVYYLNRSQPPLLTWCLSAYYEATGDKEFVFAGARWFEREFEFFQTHKYASTFVTLCLFCSFPPSDVTNVILPNFEQVDYIVCFLFYESFSILKICIVLSLLLFISPFLLILFSLLFLSFLLICHGFAALQANVFSLQSDEKA